MINLINKDIEPDTVRKIEADDFRRDRLVARSWDTKTWQLMHEFKLHNVNHYTRPHEMCLSSEGDLLFVRTSEGQLGKFEAASGRLLQQINYKHAYVNRPEISTSMHRMDCLPGKRQLALGGFSRPKIPGDILTNEERYTNPLVPVYIFNQDTLELVHSWQAHRRYFDVLASGDGRWLLTEPSRGINYNWVAGNPPNDARNSEYKMMRHGGVEGYWRTWAAHEHAMIWDTETWQSQRHSGFGFIAPMESRVSQ